MTDLRDAARQALEALEGGGDSWRLIGPAIDALKAALEQPEQEPLAIATVNESLGVVFKFSRSHTLLPGQMLYVYTHPPRREWRSLSEEEILPRYLGRMLYSHAEMLEFSRAIEAALRSKNHE
jgi:hypothetical protein